MRIDPRAGADLAVLEGGVGADDGVLLDDRRAEQLYAGQQRHVRVEHHVGVDPGRRRVHDADPGLHPAGHDPLVHHPAGPRQLHPVVDALGLQDVGDLVGADVQPGLARELDGVGEVVLALGVVVGQLGQRLDQERRVEGEDPGVDLPHRPLLVGRVLLLDDPLDLAVVVADHPAVAVGVGHHAGQDAHRPLGGLVLLGEGPQRRGLEQRGVGVRHQHRALGDLPRSGHGLHRDPDRVPGAVLLLLGREQRVRHQGLDVRADLVALVADDRDDPPRLDLLDGRQHVPDHAPPRHRVQDLHGLGLHPGAAAGSQDDDGQLSGHRLTLGRVSRCPEIAAQGR